MRTALRTAAVTALALTLTGALAASAAFSDRVDVSETTTAGSVELSRDGLAPATSNTPNPGLGSSGAVTGMNTYTNVGSLDGALKFKRTGYVFDENGIGAPEARAGDVTPDVGELQQFALWDITVHEGACPADEAELAGRTVLTDRTFRFDSQLGFEAGAGVLEAGSSVCAVTTFRVEDARNQAQGDSISFSTTALLNEVTG